MLSDCHRCGHIWSLMFSPVSTSHKRPRRQLMLAAVEQKSRRTSGTRRMTRCTRCQGSPVAGPPESFREPGSLGPVTGCRPPTLQSARNDRSSEEITARRYRLRFRHLCISAWAMQWRGSRRRSRSGMEEGDCGRGSGKALKVSESAGPEWDSEGSSVWESASCCIGLNRVAIIGGVALSSVLAGVLNCRRCQLVPLLPVQIPNQASPGQSSLLPSLTSPLLSSRPRRRPLLTLQHSSALLSVHRCAVLLSSVRFYHHHTIHRAPSLASVTVSAPSNFSSL